MASTMIVDILQGRVAVLTGASGGIGGAVALRLAESGADLVLTFAGHADQTEELADRVRAMGRRAEVVRADFADPAAPAAVARLAEERLGAVDVLVTAAAAAVRTSWEDVDEKTWDHTMAVNGRGPFFLARQLVPGMVERGFGRVLLFSSTAAFNGGTIGPHYASSKAALHGLVHYLAGRVAGSGVTVNALAPALIGGTWMLPGSVDGPLPMPVPVGRLGTVDEVADMAMAMLRNGYLTDKVIALDGGLLPGSRLDQ
ncbi:MAG: 3-oxoacyl-ACP reductase [Pseudonocardia sp. 73-21]|nr:MAG: 3-oxoacyl-ACP reductase [Pseudonocardia sp. 73-21]